MRGGVTLTAVISLTRLLGLRRVKPGGKRTNHTKSGKKAHKSRHRGTRTAHRPAAGSAPATRPDVGSPPPQEEGGGALVVPCSRALGSAPPVSPHLTPVLGL